MRMSSRALVLGALVAASVLGMALAAVPGDQITSLPGFSGVMPSKQYSGFLEVASGRFLHYWFVESESNPQADPVVLWVRRTRPPHATTARDHRTRPDRPSLPFSRSFFRVRR